MHSSLLRQSSTGLRRAGSRLRCTNDNRYGEGLAQAKIGFATTIALLLHKCLSWFRRSESMTAEQIIKEIEALPKGERERLVQRMRELGSSDIPQDFIDALEDFEKERFVSMETALNETPPGA